MSTIRLHLDDGATLELDAEAIPPGTRFIVQTDSDVTREQAANFRSEIERCLGPDIRFVIVSGARIIPIPPTFPPAVSKTAPDAENPNIR